MSHSWILYNFLIVYRYIYSIRYSLILLHFTTSLSSLLKFLSKLQSEPSLGLVKYYQAHLAKGECIVVMLLEDYQEITL